MELPAEECDVLVVGQGIAGCLASVLLARNGQKVCTVSRGTGCTALSTARVSLSGVARSKDVSKLLRQLGEGHGLFGGAQGREEGISNLGTRAPQDLSSPHDWLRSRDERTAVLGLRGNGDLDPDLLCRMMGKEGVRHRPCWTGLALPHAIHAGDGPTMSEEAGETVDGLASVLSELEEEAVVMPPLFVGTRHEQALATLERRSGRMVREPATPLSNPGRRLQSCLEDAVVRSGCRVMREREVIGVVYRNGEAEEVIINSGMRTGRVRFRTLVIASGNMVPGGLQIGGEAPYDPVFGLSTIAAPTGKLRSAALTRALGTGLEVREGRAVHRDGTVLRNVLVAGSACPGMSYPLGKGLGHAASSALSVAEMAGEL